MPAGVEAAWLPSPRAAEAAGADAIWVAPGHAVRGRRRGARRDRPRASTTARRCSAPAAASSTPSLALARRAGLAAAHAEAEPEAEDPLIAPLACSLYGEEREVTCVPGTRLAAICGTAPFTGFHFCGFGLAPGREADLEAAGAVVVGPRARTRASRASSCPAHPFFLATLFQPQVGALDGRPRHPLVAALRCAAALRPSATSTSGSRPRRPSIDSALFSVT